MADTSALADFFADLTAGSQTFDIFTKQAEKVTEALDDQLKKVTALNDAIKTGAYAAFLKSRAQLDAAEQAARHAARLEELRARYGAFGAAAITVGEQVRKSVGGMTAGVQAFASVAQTAFAGAVASVTGFARAGLQGTAEAARLSVQFQFLSREIASVFRPVVDSVTTQIAQLVEWFRGLTGEQQDNLLAWAKGAVVGLTVAAILPKVFVGIQALVVGFNLLTAAITGTLSSTGLGALLPILGFAVAGLTALVAGTLTATGAFDGFWDALKPIGAAVQEVFAALTGAVKPAVEQLTALWSRAVKIIMPYVRELAALLGELARLVGGLLGTAFKMTATIIEGTLIPALRGLVPVIQEVVRELKEMVKWTNWGLERLGLISSQAAERAAERSIAKMTEEQFEKAKEVTAAYAKATGNDVDEALAKLDRIRSASQAARRDVTPARIQFEQSTETFRRLQVAALNVGASDPAQETAKNTRAIAENTAGTKRAVERQLPAVDTSASGTGGDF